MYFLPNDAGAVKVDILFNVEMAVESDVAEVDIVDGSGMTADVDSMIGVHMYADIRYSSI